jgi:hypothetical protein
VFISSLTIAEIRRGVLEKPPGRKRRELASWFTADRNLKSNHRPANSCTAGLDPDAGIERD